MRAAAVGHGVGHHAERVAEAGVLGERAVVEVELVRVALGHRLAGQRRHVLDDAAGLAHGLGDHRLGLLVEVDQLGVAAAFEVAKAVVAPDGLVVTDQLAAGVGRERGLAGAGEAEQDRAVALLADVGRAVHGETPFLRQQIVADGEDGLLVDAAVVGTAGDHAELVAHVDDDGDLAAAAVTLRLADEAGHVEHGPAAGVDILHTLEVLREHVVDEGGMGGVFAHEAVGHGEVRIAAHEDVLHVERCLLVVQVLGEALDETLVLGGVVLAEVGLEPDLVLDLRPGDREGVLGAPARAVRVGVVDQRTLVAEHGGEGLLGVVRSAALDAALVVGDGLVEELGLAQVVFVRDGFETEELFEISLKGHCKPLRGKKKGTERYF